MQVEIWTDIICPWCGIGHHRLERALAQFAHAGEVTLVQRSFQLDENAPTDRTESARSMLRAKKGMSDEQMDAIGGHIQKLAEADGLRPYVVLDNQVGNTSLAHELAAWATSEGRGREIWDALYRAYFGEARSIFDAASLVAIAGEVGLDADAAREALSSRRYAAQVRADGEAARALGVRGVPFVLVDRRYAVSGAQPTETLTTALERAWADRAAAGAVQDGAACAAEGC